MRLVKPPKKVERENSKGSSKDTSVFGQFIHDKENPVHVVHLITQ